MYFRANVPELAGHVLSGFKGTLDAVLPEQECPTRVYQWFYGPSVLLLEEAYHQLRAPALGLPQLRLLRGLDSVHQHDERTCKAILELEIEVVIRNTVHHNILRHEQFERPPRSVNGQSHR